MKTRQEAAVHAIFRMACWGMWRHLELTFLRRKEEKLLLQSRSGTLTVCTSRELHSPNVRDVSCYLQCNIVHSECAAVVSLNLDGKRSHFRCSNTHLWRVEVGNLLKLSPIISLRYVYDRPWGPTSLLYTGVPRLLPWGSAAGAWCWPATPCSDGVEERAELYLYSSFGPSFTFMSSSRPAPRSTHPPVQWVPGLAPGAWRWSPTYFQRRG